MVEKYLAGEASLDEREDVRLWYETDTTFGSWLKEEIMSASPMVDATVGRRIRRQVVSGRQGDRGARRFSGGMLAMSVAASVLLMLALGFIVIGRHDMPPSMPLAVKAGAMQQSRVTLPDGTAVNINSVSEVVYSYDGESRRRVVELKGEAFFDVASDAAHPFVVKCDGVEVECRGTQFNVKNYPDDTVMTVALKEGSVLVSEGGNQVTMTPDMVVHYDKSSHRLETRAARAADYCEWVDGYMRFNAERLDDILRTVERRYGVRVNILDGSLNNVRFTGSMGDKDLNGTLRTISAAAGLTVHQENDSVFYLSRNP